MIHTCLECYETVDCEGRDGYCSKCVSVRLRKCDALEDENAELKSQCAKLAEGLRLAIEWLDEVCNPHNEELATKEGVAVFEKLAALLAEVKP